MMNIVLDDWLVTAEENHENDQETAGEKHKILRLPDLTHRDSGADVIMLCCCAGSR